MILNLFDASLQITVFKKQQAEVTKEKFSCVSKDCIITTYNLVRDLRIFEI